MTKKLNLLFSLKKTQPAPRCEDVCIKGYSNELGCEYYANYRWIENELNLLRKVGFKISEVVDIYPDEFNRWKNTKFYALVCEK